MTSPIPTAALRDLLSWVDVFWGHHEADGVRDPTQAKAVIRELLEARDVIADILGQRVDTMRSIPAKHKLVILDSLWCRARALLPQDHA